jgi:geranylgeranyl diphosphate synthase type II
MKIEDKLQEAKEAVDINLEKLLIQDDSLLSQAMRYAVLSGGKRFRPLLAIFSGECFGLDRAVVLPYACAVELIHNYSLIHDDLPAMDNDDVRRGQPSCHKAFGEDIALLAGDTLLTLAFEMLAGAHSSGVTPSKKMQLIQEIARSAGIQGMAGGQLLDITLRAERLKEEELFNLMYKKTGALILASVKVGPILADASPSDTQAIIDYGKNIGLAFQIRDDIIDYPEESFAESSSHPNAAAFFGKAEARKKMEGCVSAGIEALDAVSLKSKELRFLALKLLEFQQKD